MYETQDIETLRSAIYEGNNNFLGYYNYQMKVR